MGYLKDLETAAELEAKDMERLGSVAREVRQNEATTKKDVHELLEGYKLTTQELEKLHSGEVSDEPKKEEPKPDSEDKKEGEDEAEGNKQSEAKDGEKDKKPEPKKEE